MAEPAAGYGSRYLDLRSDFVFKYVFGREAHIDLLIDLLKSVLRGRRAVGDLRFGATERPGEERQARTVLFDLLCTTGQGDQILVEMQRSRQDFFPRRLLYYACRMASQQVPFGKNGDRYDLPDICAIAFLDFNCWKGDSYLNVYDLLYLLSHLGRLQEPVFQTDPLFRKLFQITEITNLRKEDRKMLIDHERDLRNIAEVWKRNAERKGIRKGMEKEKLSMVQTLIRETGFDDDRIAALVGVKPSLVQRLRQGK